MKTLFIFLFGINLMAQQITPYPYPNYDEDLLAKELVNGTYMASINMLVRNSQTGEERYVHVPDSPPTIEKLKSGNRESNTKVESVSDTKIYDRNKSLEDAVLPIYVETPNEDPIIISRAMCPQGLTYETQTDDTYGAFIARFDDGESEFFVGADKTDDGDSASNFIGDVYTFFQHVGSEKTKMFDLECDDYGVIRWLYSIGYRNFFYTDDKILYEYTKSGFTKVLDVTIGNLENIMVMDGDDIYLISFGSNEVKAQNIISGNIITLDSEQSTSNGSYNYVSAFNTAYFGVSPSWFYIKNGKIYDNLNPKDLHKATMKVRFDYHRTNYPTKYNLRRGIANAPKTRTPSNSNEFLGVKEGYVIVGTDGIIYYTPNYKNYISTGISAIKESKIVITRPYIYFYRSGDLIVVSVDDWSFKVPDGRYAELFNRNKLNDKFYETVYIGD